MSKLNPDLPLDQLRGPLARAMLPHVQFDGWGDKALLAAAADLGIPADRARLILPGGPAAMITAAVRQADSTMVDDLAARGLGNMKIRDRITTAVRTRLEAEAPVREALRRSAAVLALPVHARLSAELLWGTADAMWRAAGDTATDFNYYSKRTILSGVYAATLLVWLQDESDGFADTWAFLDRRIAGVMRFEKVKAQWRQLSDKRPSLSRFIGRLRYPAV